MDIYNWCGQDVVIVDGSKSWTIKVDEKGTVDGDSNDAHTVQINTLSGKNIGATNTSTYYGNASYIIFQSTPLTEAAFNNYADSDSDYIHYEKINYVDRYVIKDGYRKQAEYSDFAHRAAVAFIYDDTKSLDDYPEKKVHFRYYTINHYLDICYNTCSDNYRSCGSNL
jgi:hypothetical protein